MIVFNAVSRLHQFGILKAWDATVEARLNILWHAARQPIGVNQIWFGRCISEMNEVLQICETYPSHNPQAQARCDVTNVEGNG